jgi:hypothetical protein
MKKKKRRTENTPPEEVPAPPWVQKRMLRNREKAARNKIRPPRAKRAMKVRRALGEENRPGHTSTPLVAKPTVAGAGRHEPGSVERAPSRIRKFLNTAVAKYTGRLRAFGSKFQHKGRDKTTTVGHSPKRRLAG